MTDREQTGSPTSISLPTCAALRASGKDAQTLLNDFERQYPRALVDPATVDTVVMTDAQVGSTTAYLTCLAELSDYDPFVVEQSLALFDSPRHGRKAMAALADLADSDRPEAEAGGRFAEQVRAFLAAPSD